MSIAAQQILDSLAMDIARQNDSIQRCGGMRLPVSMARRYQVASAVADELAEPDRSEALAWLRAKAGES
jgi:hypothetical protein